MHSKALIQLSCLVEQLKGISINSDPRPGYFSPIIPTKTGTYQVELKEKFVEFQLTLKFQLKM